MAEYEALVNGLRITVEYGIRRLYTWGDSELIVNQVMGESNYHNSHMVSYRQEMRRLEEKLDDFKIHHVLQLDNEVADALARLMSRQESPPPEVYSSRIYSSPLFWSMRTPQHARSRAPRMKATRYSYQEPHREKQASTIARGQPRSPDRTDHTGHRAHKGSSNYCWTT
jgi:hypothetical protein